MKKPLRYIDLGRQAYRPVWEYQQRLQRQRINGDIPDTLLFVEHNPVYTIGKNGSDNHVIASDSFLRRRGIEVVEVDRGGDVTYHGPGQLVGYPIFDLKDHQKSVSWFMRQMEQVFIDLLSEWQIESRREDGYTGVWVGQEKLVALGVRISRWVTMHGFALNVNNDLEDFGGIIPCGIFHKGVTALNKLLERPLEMAAVKEKVLSGFSATFGFSEVVEMTADLENVAALSTESAAIPDPEKENRGQPLQKSDIK